MKNNAKQLGYRPKDSNNTNGLFKSLLSGGILSLKSALDRIVEKIHSILDSLTGINAILESNDVNFDTLQEVVDGIKSNSASITTNASNITKKLDKIDVPYSRTEINCSGMGAKARIQYVNERRDCPFGDRLLLKFTGLEKQHFLMAKIKGLAHNRETGYQGWMFDFNFCLRHYYTNNEYGFIYDKQIHSLGGENDGYWSIYTLDFFIRYNTELWIRTTKSGTKDDHAFDVEYSVDAIYKSWGGAY